MPSKKQIKVLLLILELFLMAALFLPAGRINGVNDNTLSVFGMIARYGGMGFSDDALFFMILSGAFPVAVIFSVFFVRERYNFGIAAVMNAFYTVASACFFSAAARRLVDYSSMTLLPYLIIFVSLAAMLLAALGFLLSEPTPHREKNGK